MDSPDQNACSKRSMALRVREYKKILSIAIAHTQTEHASSPSMTALTIQCACKNSAISDTSAATGASSAGFIRYVLSNWLFVRPSRRQTFAVIGGGGLAVPNARTAHGKARQLQVCVSHGRPVPRAGPCIPRQHVKTRADSMRFAPVSRHEAWLTRGYRGGGNWTESSSVSRTRLTAFSCRCAEPGP